MKNNDTFYQKVFRRGISNLPPIHISSGNPIRSNSSIMLLKIDAEFADSISIKLTHSSTTALLYTSTYLTPKARSVLGL
jgi:hypothetical protein